MIWSSRRKFVKVRRDDLAKSLTPAGIIHSGRDPEAVEARRARRRLQAVLADEPVDGIDWRGFL